MTKRYKLYKTLGKYMVNERDITILRHAADGFTYRQIAGKMSLSFTSIAQYVWYMKFDLNARSLAHLVSMAYDLGILIPKLFIPRFPVRREIVWKKKPKIFLRDAGDLITGKKP